MKIKKQISKLEEIAINQKRINPNVCGYSAAVSFEAGVIPQDANYTKYEKDIKPNVSKHSASVGFGATVVPKDMNYTRYNRDDF